MNAITFFDTVTDRRPVHLYFSRQVGRLDLTEEDLKIVNSQPRKIIICRSWNELPEKLRLPVKSICVDPIEFESSSAMEVVNMVNTLCKLVGKADKISISAAVWRDTPYSLVKELQKSDIQGIIPNSKEFTIDETMRALHAQWNGIPYWPKHITDQLPGSKKSSVPKIKLDPITLTPRQQQIFNIIIERGASNKIIARTLNISESTVKLHLGHIFKKYGVKTRTQLAVFARQ